MKASKKFIPCSAKTLPADQLLSAAATAIAHNPANRPTHAAAAMVEYEPLKLAVMTSKWLGAKGVKIGAYFMDNPPTALRSEVLGRLNAWNKWANISVTESADPTSPWRIAFRLEGHYAYLGSDCFHVPAAQQTMNLQITLRTSAAEMDRVVKHEGGHWCGAPHEHMRRELVARLNRTKTIRYFGRTQNWSPQEVEQQVLTPVDEALLMATLHPEQDSIMCYSLPGEITKDGRPIIGGKDITESDGRQMGKVYPLRLSKRRAKIGD